MVRDLGPAGMEIAAGEYGWNAMSLRQMLAAESVDVLQADATRCGGVTGFMDVASLADAHPIPLSAHCAPSIHPHLACAARPCVTSNIFMITCASNACCSTASEHPVTDVCIRTSLVPDSVSNSKRKTRNHSKMMSDQPQLLDGPSNGGPATLVEAFPHAENAGEDRPRSHSNRNLRARSMSLLVFGTSIVSGLEVSINITGAAIPIPSCTLRFCSRACLPWQASPASAASAWRQHSFAG